MTMTVVQQTMWQHLRSLPLDLPDHPLPFTERLRSEQGWPRAFTDRVVAEYRRFLLLAATAEDMLVPSDVVDQAWHLHLLDTRAYWDGLCGLVGKPIHHTPSRGGPAERARHRDRYEVTLERYRDVFGEDPPADVWPRSDERFAGRYRRVNVDESWVVPKRWPRNAGFASIPLVLAGCATVTGNVLVGLGLVLVLAIVVGAIASNSDAAQRKHTRDGGGGGAAGCGGGGGGGDSGGGGGCGGGSGCG